jgi:uncharacterized protein DUF4920
VKYTEPMRRFAPTLMLPLHVSFACSALACALLALACESGKPPATGSAPLASPPPKAEATAPPAAAPAVAAEDKAAAGGVQRFGAAIEPGREATLAELLKTPGSFKDADVITTGTVRRACSRKGCWMELARGEEPGCRVTFKDYGFFVPTDSAGAQARVQGRLETQEIAPARVRHLEAEGAKFAAKKPDGSATEVTLIATAVELTR